MGCKLKSRNNKNDASQKPDTLKHIHCTPVVFGEPEKGYFPLENWSHEEIEKLFENMQKDGINLIILMGGFGEKVYFPSKILKNQLDYDGYGMMFDLAGKHGIDVTLSGVSYTFYQQFEGKAWNPKAELEMNKQIFSELNELYGKRFNFYGWYIPQEAGDRKHRGDIMTILRELPGFLKKLTPDKKVGFSPWFTSHLTVGADATTPAEFADEWDAILSQVEGLDICSIQDSTAPYDQIGKWFEAAQPVFKKHGVALWNTVELFYRNPKTGWPDMTRSVDFPYLIKKMTMAAPYVEGVACWEYQNFLNPDSRLDSVKQLNRDYRNWFFAGSNSI